MMLVGQAERIGVFLGRRHAQLEKRGTGHLMGSLWHFQCTDVVTEEKDFTPDTQL
jgi:hypothetical protein